MPTSGQILRLVMDCLKPYEPEIHVISTNLIERGRKSNIEAVNVTVYEMDRLTQKVKITVEGRSLNYEEISDILIAHNCIVHSLDQCVAGERIIEDIDTPQD